MIFTVAHQGQEPGTIRAWGLIHHDTAAHRTAVQAVEALAPELGLDAEESWDELSALVVGMQRGDIEQIAWAAGELSLRVTIPQAGGPRG